MYDVAIIGAGITGCSIARLLSKHALKTVIMEKESDIADCTTKANSAIIHAGYDAKPGTLKAKLNVLGNKAFDALCEELDVPFKRVGSLVIALSDADMGTIQKLYAQGLENGVPDIRIINKEELNMIEPNISDNAIAALYAPTCGIVGPMELAVALAENAADNGVDIRLDTLVTGISKVHSGFDIATSRGTILSKTVINCAGLNADEVNDMVALPRFRILPRRGEYNILDRSVGNLVNTVVFQCPSELGKGILVSPTVHGNLLIGPNSEDIDEKDNFETTKIGLDYVHKTAGLSVKSLPAGTVITAFSGLRARPDTEDFVIEESPDAAGFINVAGIESPGLAASPAIAEYVLDILKGILPELPLKQDFNPKRRKVIRFIELSDEERHNLIQKDSRYGRIICRCETVTEAEIVDAINRNAGARTMDAIKRRVRPGMGRCQGGFCAPRVMEILARELGIDITQVVKDHPESFILTGETKKVPEESMAYVD